MGFTDDKEGLECISLGLVFELMAFSGSDLAPASISYLLLLEQYY